MIEQEAIDYFFDHVIQTDGCWGWNGGSLCRGYPLVKIGATRRISYRANRLSWLIHYGPIPPGLQVLHTCDNPICTNPEHLFLGTHLDNVSDMLAKGRGAYQKNPNYWLKKGSEHGVSKLTEEQVLEIRRLRSIGMKQREIAKQFGITRGNVGHIVRREAWTHV